ncbi:MAG: DHH family phosphoesterase [Oscillospiraceae bacterium]|jgi:phosphoesterase RecJ-like protein|nr:DHH family phosphoesterase [Oscillospiraceae bacterium]
MKLIDLRQAALRLQSAGAVLLLAHQHPDGDTLGSAFALAHALQTLGRPVNFLCEDPIPAVFDFMREGLELCEREDALVVCVDVADQFLLGKGLEERFGGRVALAVDHHATNTLFARETLLDADSAATAEMIHELLALLDVPIDRKIAACLYAGISTDTGCFRYSNTTARSHRYAAHYLELGVPSAELDRAFFETKTKTYAALERMALEGMRYFCGGRVALITVTQEMLRRSGSNEEEYIRLVPQTRQIEGVLVGVSVRERKDGSFKLSLRSNAPVNAADICAKMGGGGHARAAGCASELPLEETIRVMIAHIADTLEEYENRV